jgi:DNA helicase IV
MCGDSWYINDEDLDQYQREVINEAPTNQSYIVTGCAGSGKTNLAIWKAQEIQSNKRGSFYLIVYTKALRIFIEDGLTNAQLDKTRVMHYARWVLLGCPSADYLIVDEAQDFSTDEIRSFRNHSKIACILYGDSAQQIYNNFPNKEDLINLNHLPPDIAAMFPLRYDLLINHRLPKKVARVAGQMIDKPELEFQCSDEGNYKPLIKDFHGLNEQLEFIMQRISSEQLTHVGILHPYRNKVIEAYNDIRAKNYNVHVRIDDNAQVITHEDLNFNIPAIPKLCTYHSAKGLQFHHVFLIDCSIDFFKFFRALYVAVTRTCDRLFIYHSEGLSPYFNKVDDNLFDYGDGLDSPEAWKDQVPEEDLPF